MGFLRFQETSQNRAGACPQTPLGLHMHSTCITRNYSKISVEWPTTIVLAQLQSYMYNRAEMIWYYTHSALARCMPSGVVHTYKPYHSILQLLKLDTQSKNILLPNAPLATGHTMWCPDFTFKYGLFPL